MVKDKAFDNVLEEVIGLRRKLHNCPEPAFHERKTKKAICDYLSISCSDTEPWLLVACPGTGPNAKRIILRADMDAVVCEEGTAAHLCGHDGHAAVLAGVCRILLGSEHKNDVYCLFQPAEETGRGADACIKAVKDLKADAVYGFHNIPGYEAGTVLIKDGSFACASTGLELEFIGRPAHAAYPEAGANPAYAMANTMMYADYYTKQHHDGMLMSTVIGMELGSASYGMAASRGKLRLTLRGEKEDEFREFSDIVCGFAGSQDASEDLEVKVAYIYTFPATTNDSGQTERVMNACLKKDLLFAWLSKPFPWSEDFGVYLHQMPGAFFGVGAGIGCPDLHTAEYEFPDEIINPAMTVLLALCE